MINHAPKFQRILKFTASGNLDMNRLMNRFYDLKDKFEAVRFWYLNAVSKYFHHNLVFFSVLGFLELMRRLCRFHSALAHPLS